MHAGMHAGIIIDITGRTEKGGLGWKNKGGGEGFRVGSKRPIYGWLSICRSACLPVSICICVHPSRVCLL